VYSILKRVLLVVISGLAITGCSYPYLFDPPESEILMTHSFAAKLNTFAGFCFAVDPGEEEDLAEELSRLQEKVTMNIYDMNLFDSTFMGICEPGSKPILNVAAVVADTRRPSFLSQILGGQRARAALTVDVIFVDVATLDTVGVCSITGRSSGSALSGAIDPVCRAIVKLVRENLR